MRLLGAALLVLLVLSVLLVLGLTLLREMDWLLCYRSILPQSKI